MEDTRRSSSFPYRCKAGHKSTTDFETAFGDAITSASSADGGTMQASRSRVRDGGAIGFSSGMEVGGVHRTGV